MMASQPDATGTGGAGDAGGAGAEGAAGGGGELALDTYDMTGNKYLLIFNHYKFQETSYFRASGCEPLEPRLGTAHDVAALTAAFEALGFAVTAHHDRTHDQIVDIMAKFCGGDHSSTACVGVAVLTHGAEGGLLAAADKWYALRDLLAPLQGARALAGRPKLLLLQACRGRRRDDGLRLDGAAAGPTTGSHADTLIFYSTVECFVSWRAENGSWAVQELCRVLRARPALDVLRATTLATHRVTRQYASTHHLPCNHNKKQTPETCSTLTKLLRFTPPAAPPAPPPPAAPPAPPPPAAPPAPPPPAAPPAPSPPPPAPISRSCALA